MSTKRYPSVWAACEAVAMELNGGVSGACYIASCAVYILAGRKKSRLKLYFGLNPEPHYWLRGPRNEFIDLTAGQFKKPATYYVGGKRGSFSKQMPHAARILAKRAQRFLRSDNGR